MPPLILITMHGLSTLPVLLFSPCSHSLFLSHRWMDGYKCHRYDPVRLLSRRATTTLCMHHTSSPLFSGYYFQLNGLTVWSLWFIPWTHSVCPSARIIYIMTSRTYPLLLPHCLHPPLSSLALQTLHGYIHHLIDRQDVNGECFSIST